MFDCLREQDDIRQCNLDPFLNSFLLIFASSDVSAVSNSQSLVVSGVEEIQLVTSLKTQPSLAYKAGDCVPMPGEPASDII